MQWLEEKGINTDLHHFDVVEKSALRNMVANNPHEAAGE